MKNVKKLVGSLALALAAFAAAPRASLAGDIKAIFPVDSAGNQISGAASSISNPLVAGDTVRFAIQLTPRTGATPGSYWALTYTGIGSEAAELLTNPYRIGIYVSGELRYATYVSQVKSGSDSVFYFEYQVRPGDFALPIVLATGSSGKPANGSEFSSEPYYVPVMASGSWEIRFGGDAATTADLTFGTSGTNRDYDLRAAGFYVKTLGFDEDEESDAWRSVPAGTTRTGDIHVDTMPTNTATLYVWSMDESVVAIKGGEEKDIHFVNSTTEPEKRQVATIKVQEGIQDYTISFTGTGAAGSETKLVLCTFADFTYPVGTSERREDYLTATVKVTEAPEPYMSLTDPSGSSRISIEATTNTTACQELRLTFSKPYADGPVTVKFKQQVNGTDVAAADDYIENRYFSILLDPENDPVSTVSVKTDEGVTMAAGETELRLYVFALGSTAELKSPGLTLVPDVSDNDANVQAFFAAGKASQKNALLKISDQAPVVSVTAPTSGFKNDEASISVTVSDNWRDLQTIGGTAWNTDGYSVRIRIGGQVVVDETGVKFAEDTPVTFKAKLPADGTLKGVVEVSDATHTTASTAEFTIDVEPARSATPLFYADTETTEPYADTKFFSEGEESLYFGVKLTNEASMDMYAFLVPLDENASNLVQCAAFTNGVKIASGSLVSERKRVTLLDGWSSKDPMVARFRVELRSAMDLADKTSVSYNSSYELKSTSITCVNVSPTIVAGSMELNSTKVKSGETLKTRVPVGVEVTFKAKVSDPSTIDKSSTDSPIVSRWEFSDGTPSSTSYTTVIVTNQNGYVSCPFTYGYAGTTQTVSVCIRDKDDLVESGDEDEWGAEAYSFTVMVAAAPRVIISQDQDGQNTKFSIAETARRNEAFCYVQLSEAPTGGATPISTTNPLLVELVAENWGSDGMLKLETNLVYFTNSGSATKQVYFDVASLNGAYATDFHVTARVISETTNAYGQKWKDYYAEGSMDVHVENVDPEIGTVKRETGTWSEEGTNTCTAGESIVLDWAVSDIPLDITNGLFSITWSIDGAAGYANPQVIDPDTAVLAVSGAGTAKVSGKYGFTIPNVTGTQTFTMTVDDGEGGVARRSWTYYVAATKAISVNVFGPAENAQSKYKNAKGIGQGVVAAKSADSYQVSGFLQKWIYDENAAQAELVAWGYPSKDTWDDYVTPTATDYYGVYTDRGRFPTVVEEDATGIPLSRKGNKWSGVGPYYDWSTMGGTDETAGDYDNYFYHWATITEAESDKSSSSSTSGATTDASPTTYPLSTTRKTFKLSANGDDGSYGTVEVEAIFSREMFPLDNLGDINADYVPDKYVPLYGFGASTTGSMPEDDLASLENYNDDEDYLPNMTKSIYSTLIPDLPSGWSEGKKFTARYEIRGYGDGLNNAPQLVGIKGYRLHPDYNSDDVDKRKAARDYSDFEMLAWSLTGYDKSWSPECPSDPTLSDTDDDGFTDGYEYYFWYRAHVGDIEYYKSTGNYRKLTGRRFDPRNPGVGTVITSEQIEALMNPRVAYGEGESASVVDTDNDGLPDLLEFELGTNPFDFDTDGDGLPDGWEIMIAGFDPLTSNTYTDGVSDTLRNSDGDAMAIGSYKLEESQLPVMPDYEFAKRWTFAVVDAQGDTAGVQWYATEDEPTTPVADQEYTTWWKVTATIDGKSVDFFSETEPTLVADGSKKRLGAVVAARTLVAWPDESSHALGYPYEIPVGTVVTVEEMTDAATAYVTAEEVAEDKANACWIYGKGTANAELGEVAETAADYGCLALARQKKVPAGAAVVAFPSEDRDVAFLHYLCYQEFDFDPRTAWSSKSPLASRWTGTNGKYPGTPTRTRDYAAYDEFLVYSFFLCNTTTSGETMEYASSVTDSSATEWARRWYALTTNPQGPETAERSNDEHYYGRNSANGADTDGDGVPDGWELYVMSGPKTADDAYVFAPPYGSFQAGTGDTISSGALSPFVPDAKSFTAPNGDLTVFASFEGTDSIAAYTNVSTTVAHEGSWTWLNKFFPVDPWDDDLDEDGIANADEQKAFNYGTLETTLADDGKSKFFPGGGLNPCSVDTDFDGLPDPWELQFKGSPKSLVEGEEKNGLRNGMDGTVFDAYTVPGGPNRDYDHDGLENWQEYLTGTMRCWRYDDPVSPLTYIPDELYYEIDPTTGDKTFDAAKAAEKMHDAGYLDAADVNEFWYRTLVDVESPAYNPNLVTGRASGSQYFTRVTNPWDPVYVDLAVGGAYYWFYDRIDGEDLIVSWLAAWNKLVDEGAALDPAAVNLVPLQYACCSPIDPDSDHDGMDDYYELFHGMNPLLGASGVSGVWWSVDGLGYVTDNDPCDLVYDSLGGVAADKGVLCIPQAWGEGNAPESYKNYWQRKVELASYKGPKPRGNGYDFVVFPWLNGCASADADGDGTRNQEEAIMPLVNPTTAWHHTDPTPLWMTDSSYSNSLVRMFYRMPTRENVIPLDADSFEYDGETYLFKTFGGYASGGMGPGCFLPFSLDTSWSVVNSSADMNWIASFEENEGYDSDHDGICDRDELAGKFNGKTDPIDADSPQRRQAMYFQGADKPSILQTMPFVRERHPYALLSGRYPDDMSFLQYTVECWVKAESLEDSTIIERAVYAGLSNPDDQEFIRCNFRLAIKGGKWQTLFDPNDTTTESVEAFSATDATTEWTHLAATYDATTLRLYVNGKLSGYRASGLQPSYGSASVSVDGVAGVHAKPGMAYWRDREYDLNAIIVGASAKTLAQGATDGTALDVTRCGGFGLYTNFFKGYVDEVRVWDGARSASEIAANYARRFTADDAKENRDDFYTEWCKGDVNGNYRGRYSKDGSGNAYSLPAELRFHWSFDSIFGASEEGAVAKAPAGFNYLGANAQGDGGRALRTRPDDYEIAWWKSICDAYAGTVYNDPAWVCWVPNTVSHLPRYDGTTLDSFYWSEDYAGAEIGTYSFARTAEPVSFWTQYRRTAIVDGTPYYDTTSTRYQFVVEQDATNGTNLARLYNFTGRNLNQTGDDMLALGGAYARHVDQMWDDQGPSANWEISGTDEDGDGLPDWWEKLAKDCYYDAEVSGDDADAIGWDTIVRWPDQNGTTMTAGEAYLRDLARGYHGDKDGKAVTDGYDGDYVQRADLNGNGLPDWWEKVYGIEGEDALADHDNDGLSNYVEYLLSEVFKPLGKAFDPTRADSVQEGIPDYFYKVGDLYVGEIFTDHDLVDDSWEDSYGTDYASRRVYDPYEDSDGDGWSNRSENRYSKQSMPIVANEQAHYAVTDGLVADYPIPTLSLKVHYAGPQNSAVEKSAIVVQTTTSKTLERSMDATFNIAGTSSSSGTGTSSSSGSSSSTESTANASYTRTIGKWSNRHVVGTLTPGYVDKNSLTLEFCYDPSQEEYSWMITIPYTINGKVYTKAISKRGTRAEYNSDRRKYGDSRIQLLSKSTSYTVFDNIELRTDETGQNATWYLPTTDTAFGTINLTSGAFDIDLGAFEGQYVVNSTNENEFVSLEDQYYRITYSANVAVGLPRKLYLGQADDGHVREGSNTIVAFADLDGDGAYTAGEPYGCVAGVDVSWRGTTVDLTLTETTPMMNRVDPIGGSDDRTATWGIESGNYTNFTTAAQASGGTYNRIRLVRDMVIGTGGSIFADEVGARRVVLDMVVHSDVNPWVTEANILATGALDLDWDYLYDEIVSKINSNGQIKSSTSSDLFLVGDVKSVVYGVVIGNGAITGTSTNAVNYAKIMPQRLFDTVRQSPVPVSVGSGGIVTVGRPTFKWKMENDVNGYTAFKLKIVNKSGSAFSWTSDFQRMPAADEDGVYTWSAPVFAGDTPAGATGTFANNQTYTWSISAYNAKYKTDSFVTGGDFYLNVQTNGYDTGTARASVRYYGPSVVTNKYVTRVYAYESPDFTGTPVAGGVVAAADEDGVNCRLIGIPKGTYYLQAFVDSNNNGVWDKWESMGYLCTRDGSTANYLNPVAITFGTTLGQGDVAVIYMEDADTDRDNLPDAWEYATATDAQRANGTFLDAQGVSTLTTLDGAEIPVNKSLVTSLLFEINKSAVPTAGLAGDAKSAFTSSAAFASLAMGVSSDSLTYDASTGSFSVNPTVDADTFAITGVSFDAANGEVTLTLDGDVVAAESVNTAIYTVKTGSTITVKVYRSETLAAEPELVSTQAITVGDTLNGSSITVKTDLTASSGFFKVVVE